MATKKDLQEAQGFSRRRLLTAFTSGAPGGKELEPARPLQAVIIGIALAIAVVIGGLFYGLIRPGLPDGWESNSLVLVRDTGARYVAIDGTLYPVLNTASARLLIPADQFRIVTTDAATIAHVEIGPTIGILGAPDALPTPASLRPTGWAACVLGETESALGIARDPLARPSEGAVVVRRDDSVSVIVGQHRFDIEGSVDAVLRAIGLGSVTVLPADARWVALFDPAPALGPLVVDRAGESIDQPGLRVGAVLHPDGAADDVRYLVTAEGALAPISPLAFQLYMLGTGAQLGGEVSVSPAEIADMPTTDPVMPAWPTRLLNALEGTQPCALLEHDAQGLPRSRLASAVAEPPVVLDAPGVRMQGATGALVRGGGGGSEAAGVIVLIDPTGTSFALPGADAELLARLGYGPGDVGAVTDRWLQFFAAGPALTVAAAGTSPVELAVDATGSDRCEAGVVVFDPSRPLPLSQLQTDQLAAISTGAGIRIAIIDSGIDANHPQLRGRVVGGINLVDDETDPNGFTDVERHGTAIAGLIAAQRVDGSGIVGLAPDASLLAVRVFRATDERTVEAGFGPDLAVLAEGVRWAVAQGVDVINISLSHPEGTADLAAAIAEAVAANIVVVASGGNRNTTEDTRDGPRYPGAYPGVIAVAAADQTGTVTSSSIHGPHIDIAAPGAWVSSTAAMSGNCLFSDGVPSTSYATGYVSAAATLLRAHYPGDAIETTTWRLTASASRANPDARDDRAGWGLLQPAAALTIPLDAGLRGPALDGAAAPPVPPPSAEIAPPEESPAIRATRHAAIASGILAAALVAALGVWALLRRGRDLFAGDDADEADPDAARRAASRDTLVSSGH